MLQAEEMTGVKTMRWEHVWILHGKRRWAVNREEAVGSEVGEVQGEDVEVTGDLVDC